MLTVISGPFAALEEALFERIAMLRSRPLEPVLVAAPSQRLTEYLQIKLTEKFNSLFDFHFHTFSSLAQEIINASTPLEKPILSDSLFFDTLVKFILREKRPFHRFEDLAVPDGFPPAVRATLRDLLDAGAPPEITDAVKEGFLGKDADVGVLRELLTLYQLYSDRLDALPVFPRVTLLKTALERAPQSSFLKRYSEILYYGFYDLTGVQSDFFQAVVKNFPSRFFFPYVPDNSDFSFAKRFRDTFLQPVMSSEQMVEKPAAEKVSCRFINVSGLKDEAFWVGSEILRLHEEDNIPFSEIAVVARTDERIGGEISRLFHEWKIPFQSSLAETLASSPQVAVSLALLSFRTPEEIDRFRARYKNLELIDWEMVLSERENLTTWPSEESWSSYVEKARLILSRCVSPQSAEAKLIHEALETSLDTLAAFEWLRKVVSREEFLEALMERWKRVPRPEGGVRPNGVRLFHAEAARGLRFRIVFIVGVEEKVFPRVVREDPFLRDNARLAISQTLGYKINQKMAAVEEERLLFRLLVDSAEERLYLLYQRTDDEGGIIGPSIFLAPFARKHGADLKELVETVPRPFFEKMKMAASPTMGGKEIASWYLETQNENEAFQFFEGIHKSRKDLERGLAAKSALALFTSPHAYDGCVGDQPNERVFLPHGWGTASALETFERCPFQYFARKILEVEPIEVETEGERLLPVVKGRLIHGFLERFFGHFTDRKNEWPRSLPVALFEKVFDETIPTVSEFQAQIPPLLWRVLRAQLKKEIAVYLETQFAGDGAAFVPLFVEKECVTTLPAPLDKMTWFGKWDRVDRWGDKIRVVDYKTGKLPDGKKQPQPPLYLLMAEKFFKQTENLSFEFHQVGKSTEVRELSSEDWRANQKEMVDRIRKHLDRMKSGQFVIDPAPQKCKSCSVESICRRHHGPSVWRAKKGVLSDREEERHAD